MNDNIPNIELPEFATLKERLAANIELAREAVSMRVGYEVEMAGLEPVEREGHATCVFSGGASRSSYALCRKAVLPHYRRSGRNAPKVPRRDHTHPASL